MANTIVIEQQIPSGTVAIPYCPQYGFPQTASGLPAIIFIPAHTVTFIPTTCLSNEARPHRTSIMPERFNSISCPRATPIVDEALNSISRPKA